MSKKKHIFLHIITPVFLTSVCAGIAIAASIKPADKIKTYANIAFMDTLKADPLNNDSGLVIQDNDIDTNYSGKVSEEGTVKRPSFGELYAIIKCDALGIDIPVYWGTTSELLERGACQSSSSSVVGADGNAVISAHVDTFFSDLSTLKEGDIVNIISDYGCFTYKVNELIEFSSSDRKYIQPTEDNRLTLYTCKRDLLGASDKRVGVVCELTEKAFYTEKEGN